MRIGLGQVKWTFAYVSSEDPERRNFVGQREREEKGNDRTQGQWCGAKYWHPIKNVCQIIEDQLVLLKMSYLVLPQILKIIQEIWFFSVCV